MPATPTYGASCTGPLSVSFDFTTCDLEANLGDTTSPTSGRYKTSLDVVCPTKYFTFRFGTCEVHVPAQNGLNTAYAENVAESEGYDVLLEANISGLTYEVTEDGFLCPLSGTGKKTNGTYTGKYNFFGESGTGSRIRIYTADQ